MWASLSRGLEKNTFSRCGRGCVARLLLVVVVVLFVVMESVLVDGVVLDMQIAESGKDFAFTIPWDTLRLVDNQYVFNASYSPAQTWLRFRPSLKLFEGMPGISDIGVLDVHVKLTNAMGVLMDVIDFEVDVGAAPAWTLGAADVAHRALVGESSSFLVASSDFSTANGVFLISLAMSKPRLPLPDWVTYESELQENMLVTMQPGRADVGVYEMVLLATDQKGRVGSKPLVLTVPNRDPVSAGKQLVVDAFVSRPASVDLTQAFSDPDGGKLVYFILSTGRPGWAAIDADAGVVFGTPSLFSESPSVFDVGARDSHNATATLSVAVNIGLKFFVMDFCLVYFGLGLMLAVGMVALRVSRRAMIEKFFRKAVLRQGNLEVLKLWPPPGSMNDPVATILQMQSYLYRGEYTSALPLLEVVRYYVQEVKKTPEQQVAYWGLMRLCVDDVRSAVSKGAVTYGVLQGIECVIELVNITLFDNGHHGRLVECQARDAMLECLQTCLQALEDAHGERAALAMEQDLMSNLEIAIEGLKLVRGISDDSPWKVVTRLLSCLLLPPYGMVRLLQEKKKMPSGWGWYERIIFARSCMPLVRTSKKVRAAFMGEYLSDPAWQYTYAFLELLTLLGVRGKHVNDDKFVNTIDKSILMSADEVYCCNATCGQCGGATCCARFDYFAGSHRLLIHEKAMRARKEVKEGEGRAIDLAPRAHEVLLEENESANRISRKVKRHVRRENRRVKGVFTEGLIALQHDGPRGVDLLEEAALHGHVMAMSALGHFYCKGGPGTPANLDQSFKYLFHAAMKGDVTSYGQLGLAYLGGLGTKMDEAKADMWLVRGAQVQEVGAMLGLGQRLLSGHPTDDNIAYQVSLARAEQLFQAVIDKPAFEKVGGRRAEQKELDAARTLLSDISKRRDKLRTSGSLISHGALSAAVQQHLDRSSRKHGKLLAKEVKIFKHVARRHEETRLKLQKEQLQQLQDESTASNGLWDSDTNAEDTARPPLLSLLVPPDGKHGSNTQKLGAPMLFADDYETDTSRSVGSARATLVQLSTAARKGNMMNFADEDGSSVQGQGSGRASLVQLTRLASPVAKKGKMKRKMHFGGQDGEKSPSPVAKAVLLKKAPMGFADDDSSDGPVLLRKSPAIKKQPPKKLAPIKLAPLKRYLTPHALPGRAAKEKKEPQPQPQQKLAHAEVAPLVAAAVTLHMPTNDTAMSDFDEDSDFEVMLVDQDESELVEINSDLDPEELILELSEISD
jgi:hypothetical protein